MAEIEKLIENIKTLCGFMLELQHSEVERALDMSLDRMLDMADPSDHAVLESIIDGLRWGFFAAAQVELGGGTMLRLRAPRGVAITHEWLDQPSEIQRAAIRHMVEEAFKGNAA